MSFRLSELISLNALISARSSLEEQTKVDIEKLESDYKPIYYTDLIENTSKELINALSTCKSCECIVFTTDSAKWLQEKNDVRNEVYVNHYEVSSTSESSSCPVDKNEALKLILAETVGESRKSAFDHRHQSSEFDISIRSTQRNKKNQSVIKKSVRLPPLPTKPSDNPFFKFLLPNNFERLKDLQPLTYLDKYCWICNLKLFYYKKVISKPREIKEENRILPDLYYFINAVLMNTLRDDQFDQLCYILGLTEMMRLSNIQMFNICAVAERLFYFSNISVTGEQALGILKGYQEMIDFKCINSKLSNYIIKEELKRLFAVL